MAKKSGDKILSPAEMKRKFPSSGKASEIYLDADSSLWLPSRILAFNHMIGGGIPYGKIMDLHGEESAGKSLLSTDFAYTTQALGGKVLWIDAEAAFDPAWVSNQGVDPDKIEILKDENMLEVISDWIKYQVLYWRSKLVNNEPILIILDSIANTDTRDNLETDSQDKKAEMGKRASKVYELLRARSTYISKYGAIMIGINQLRQKVGAGMFEDPDTVPGGQAMKFYASQRIGLYRGKMVKDKDKNPVGNVTYMRTKKNKVAPPKKNIKGEFYYETYNGMLGYNKYLGFLPILLEKGIVERKAGKIYYKGELLCSYKEEDEMPFIRMILKKEKLRANLIRKSGINSVSKMKEKLGSIKKNLYPVKVKSKDDGQDDE